MPENQDETPITEKELDKAIKVLDTIRKEAKKDPNYALNDDWVLFNKKMRILTTQSSGAKLQNYIFNAFGWERVSQDLGKGDVKNTIGQYFEVKVSTITTSNPTANIVQIRPWQKISGHHIFVIDSTDGYRVTHYFLTKSEMKQEVEKCGTPSHGTKEINKKNEHIERSIRIRWKENDKTFQRWKNYEQDTDIKKLNSRQ